MYSGITSLKEPGEENADFVQSLEQSTEPISHLY